MKLTEKLKNTINSWSLEQLLMNHRFSKAGDPLYQGESGEYAIKRLSQLKNENYNEFIKISKRVGWN